KFSATRMPSRFSVVNPDNSKITEYSPGGIAANRKNPSSPDTVLRVPIIDGLAMVTVTPGSTALVLSVTLPLIAPVVELVVCARAAAGAAHRQRQSHRTTRPGEV